MFDGDRPREECGVFGVFSPERQPLAPLVYYGLYALQHRGQESAGIVMNDDDEIIELINPEIVATEGKQTGLEGCLSVPGKYGVVTRPYVVRVRAQDRDGQFFEVEDEGLTARCFCHELDHLDGRLYIDVMNRELTKEEIQGHIPEDDVQ